VLSNFVFNLNLRRCIEATETDMGSVQEVVRNTRSLRAAYNLPPKVTRCRLTQSKRH
jgi:hypothetical protein